MGRLLVFLLICLLPAAPAPADETREIHVVAIGRGAPADSLYALPEAHVRVDRPGKAIGLVLLGGGNIRWRVEVTDGTAVNEILLGGPRPDSSEVVLSGIPMVGAQVPDLPLVFNPWGRDFRALLDRLAERMGAQRLHGFHGSHRFRGVPIRIDRVEDALPGLHRDYLSRAVQPANDLPGPLRRWRAHTGRQDPGVTFDATGVSLTARGETRHFPVPADMPPILLPAAAVHDPEGHRIYALSHGGPGYIYGIDTQSGDWQVVAGLEGYDAAALLFVPEERLLITTGAFSRPGDIRRIGLDGHRARLFVPTTGFPGLTDLFDFGNEHGPPLLPRAYADGWLLLEALGPRDGPDPATGAYRVYALRVATGEVRLLAFRNE